MKDEIYIACLKRIKEADLPISDKLMAQTLLTVEGYLMGKGKDSAAEVLHDEWEAIVRGV